MSKKKVANIQAKIAAAAKKSPTGLGKSVANDAVAMDVFSNVAARMGNGTPSVAEGTCYTLDRYTNDYWLMVTLFRNHWICRRIVERPAQLMTKAWPRLQCDLTPEQIAKFDRTLRQTYVANRIQRTLKWARLFGGAGALMIIDGQDDILDKPLDLDAVTPGSFKGLIPFDRWSGITPKGEVINNLDSPINFDAPEFYTVRGIEGETFDVHHSRILRFIGPDVPQPEYSAAMYWGISSLEVVFEEIRKRDNTSWTILQLMFRANILAQVNPQLAQMLSGAINSGAALQKFMNAMEAQNQLLSNNSMLILPEGGSMENHSYSFSGIAEMYAEFRADLCGAADMPEVELFGRMPGGLSQGSDANMRLWENKIAQMQVEELSPQLDKLYPVICMSEFGMVPDDLDYVYPSIRVLTAEEKSAHAKAVTDSVVSVFNAGLISQKTALQELQAVSSITEVFTNITDELIDEADDEVQVPIEVETAEARAGTEEFEETPTKKPAKKGDE